MEKQYAPEVVASGLLSHLRALEQRLMLEDTKAKQEL
jgi:hypothetical protein